MAGFIGPQEMLLIAAAVAALILGPKKLPQLARSIGESKKEYKESMKEAEEAVEEVSPDVDEEVEDVKE
jgi:TatA/E family protein of Tat protein translocase